MKCPRLIRILEKPGDLWRVHEPAVAGAAVVGGPGAAPALPSRRSALAAAAVEVAAFLIGLYAAAPSSRGTVGTLRARRCSVATVTTATAAPPGVGIVREPQLGERSGSATPMNAWPPLDRGFVGGGAAQARMRRPASSSCCQSSAWARQPCQAKFVAPMARFAQSCWWRSRSSPIPSLQTMTHA